MKFFQFKKGTANEPVLGIKHKNQSYDIRNGVKEHKKDPKGLQISTNGP